MVFTHISIEGWIIDPYVQSLFYCSHLVQVLPPNNVEVVDGNIVSSSNEAVVVVSSLLKTVYNYKMLLKASY